MGKADINIEEAIKVLKDWNKAEEVVLMDNDIEDKECYLERKYAIETVLNLIQEGELQKKRLQAELEKKDEIIDKAIELIEKEENYYTDKAYEFLEKGNFRANKEMMLQANYFTKARWIISELVEEQINFERKVEE